jgi:hypothetical protein
MTPKPNARAVLTFLLRFPLFPHLPLLLLSLGLVAAWFHRGHASISIILSLTCRSAAAATSARAPAQCPNSSAAVSARSMTVAGAALARLARKE